jgi:hypothetical protein
LTINSLRAFFLLNGRLGRPLSKKAVDNVVHGFFTCAKVWLSNMGHRMVRVKRGHCHSNLIHPWQHGGNMSYWVNLSNV